MNHPDPFSTAEQAIRDGDIQEACKILRANLGDKRRFIETRHALAELYLRQRKYSPAQKLLLEVLARSPEHVQTLSLLAHIVRIQGETANAAQYLDRAVHTNSTSQNELKFISSEFIALGAYQSAIRTIQKIEPMDAQCFYHLGLAHFKLGQIGKALPIYRKLFSSIPDSPTIARELSLVAAAFREYDTAVEAYTRYMQLIQPRAADFLKFSDLQLMNRDIAESEEHLEKAIAMGEDSANVRLLQARLCRLKGDYSVSLSEAMKVVTEQPESGTAWNIISELIEPAAIDAKLIDQLTKAIASPAIKIQDKELTQFALAELYTKRGNYSAAYRRMRTANQTKKQLLHNQGIRYNRQAVEDQFKATRQAFETPSYLPASTNQRRPVFIVGMPRSGTTIVNRILGASGQLQCVGESEAMPYIHSQLQLRFGGGAEKFADKLSANEWNQMAADYLLRVKAGDLEIVDKMPSNFHYVGMILSIFPRARIVQLRRNSFDACMSIFAKPFPEGHNYACDVNDLAHFYFQTNSLMDYWSRTYPEQVLDLDFDQFLESPHAYGEQLFSFLEYKWKEEYLAPPRKYSQAFTFSELQIRKPISKNEANKWQPFTDPASDLIEAIESESLASR